jgi:hypothetical protein
VATAEACPLKAKLDHLSFLAARISLCSFQKIGMNFLTALYFSTTYRDGTVPANLRYL